MYAFHSFVACAVQSLITKPCGFGYLLLSEPRHGPVNPVGRKVNSVGLNPIPLYHKYKS